jgi:hypothetical protein
MPSAVAARRSRTKSVPNMMGMKIQRATSEGRGHVSQKVIAETAVASTGWNVGFFGIHAASEYGTEISNDAMPIAVANKRERPERSGASRLLRDGSGDSDLISRG